MAVNFQNLSKQYESIKAEMDQAVLDVLAQSHFILGPNVKALEEETARYCGVKHAIGVASGTDALILSLRACGIKSGDEVITSPFTFIATAEAISIIGAKPVFADIDLNTFNLDPKEVEKKITKHTRAILPVHLYGQIADMDAINKIAKQHGLRVIEDACQAIGAKYNGKKAGALGDAAAFSYFPTKNLGGCGDGGIITTNDDQVAEMVKILRAHGSVKTYHHDYVGYNSRLDEIQAAIIRVKMKYIDLWNEKRRTNAALYNSLLANTAVTLPVESKGNYHIYHQYTLRIKNRDQVQAALKEKGIASMIYYPIPLHLQKAYAFMGYKVGDFSNAEKAQAEVLSLPICAELEEAEVREVAEGIKTVI